MAHARLTLLDIAKMNNSDEVAGLIDETVVAHPEWTTGFARTIKGINYKTLVRTALPAAGFRGANEGIEVTKSTLENRLVEAFLVDASWNMDTGVADPYEDGPEACCALEASAHMESAIIASCKQFYYGAASGVTGAAVSYAGLIDVVDSGMIVDAGGTTGSTGSSVWGIRWGPQHVAWVAGREGRFDEDDTVKQLITISSKDLWAYAQQIQGYLGVQVGNKYAIGRIWKLTEDSGKGLTDAVIAKLLEKFPVGTAPDVLAMNRRSLRQLQSSRTATNPTGAPAPFPDSAFGIPIMVTDSIISTEAIA